MNRHICFSRIRNHVIDIGLLLKVFSSNVGIIRAVGEPQPKFMARVHTQRFSIYNETFKNCDKFGVTKDFYI